MGTNLNALMAKINKEFGENSIGFAKDRFEELRVKYIPTPSEALNQALGGGLGVGRIIELYGEAGCGKSTLCLEVIGKCMKEDPTFMAGWFENERSFDPEFAEKMGVDLSRLVFWNQDKTAEESLEFLRALIASGELQILIVNSVAGLLPQTEATEDLEKQSMALTARLLSKLMRVITNSAGKNNCTVIFTNQLRTNIGAYSPHGSIPTITTGGKALRFYSTQRIKMVKCRLEKGDPITEDEGMKVKCQIDKNRLAKGNPYVSTQYYAVYGIGIDKIVELPPILEDNGLVTKSGSWYKWERNGVEEKVNSKAAFVDLLRSDKELLEFFESKLDGSYVQVEQLSGEEIEKIKEEDSTAEEEIEVVDKSLEEEEADKGTKKSKSKKK